MKTLLFIPMCLAAATFALAEEKKSDKTLGEKAADTLEKAGEKTKDVGRTVADKTKEAAEAVKDAVTPDKDARKVKVRLIDHDIEMPKQVEPGKTAFVVTNGGSKKHYFGVEGQGIEKKFLTSVEPNETKTLHVELKPGTYKIYCPVGDHEEQGMKFVLTVK